MDTEDSLESKCENLMNIVVESRKRFGKTCVEYDKKIHIIEQKLLNLQTETICNYRFKPKNAVQAVDEESCKELDDILVEIADKQKRVEELKRRLKNTHEVISQLEADSKGKKLEVPLTANAMLARAKAKQL